MATRRDVLRIAASAAAGAAWSPTNGESAGASLTSVKRARETGLQSRPLQETVRDTLEWFHSLPQERQANLHAGLDSRKETDTLHAWHQSTDRA